MDAGIEQQRQEESYCATMTRQSHIAREAPLRWKLIELDGQEHLNPSLGRSEEIVWLVEDAMPQSGTNHHAKKAVENERVELAGLHPFSFLVEHWVNSLVLEEPANNEIRCQNGQNPPHCVPAHTVPKQVENLYIGLPVYV